MRILALDTATDRASLALLEDGVVRAVCAASVDARHGETLMAHLASLMSEAGWAPAELGCIAVGLGPGSFTGVRIGVAAAKGLAIALRVPVVGIETLEIVANGVTDPGEVLVALDAKKGEVFHQRFAPPDDAGVRVALGEPGHDAPEVVARAHPATTCTVVGTGVGSLAALEAAWPSGWRRVDPSLDHPSAVVLARLAQRRLAASGPSDVRSLVPRYVRGADAVPQPMPTSR